MENSMICKGATVKHNWLPIVCEHLIRAKPVRGFWTKEKKKKKALPESVLKRAENEENLLTEENN